MDDNKPNNIEKSERFWRPIAITTTLFFLTLLIITIMQPNDLNDNCQIVKHQQILAYQLCNQTFGEVNYYFKTTETKDNLIIDCSADDVMNTNLNHTITLNNDWPLQGTEPRIRNTNTGETIVCTKTGSFRTIT